MPAVTPDGHECMLRIMCEAAHTPTHGDGLIGDAINALLLPAHLLDLGRIMSTSLVKDVATLIDFEILAIGLVNFVFVN